MSYKVGDKVKIINNKEGYNHRKNYIGMTVIVKSINPNGVNAYKERHYGVCDEGKNVHIPFVFFESELTPVNNRKIVITTDGVETLARLYEGNKVIKTATAKCSPDDTFDFEVGARTAFDRLIDNPALKALRTVAQAAKKCGEAICKSANSIKKSMESDKKMARCRSSRKGWRLYPT